MPYVLADTGVWYALCDSRDSLHSKALAYLMTFNPGDFLDVCERRRVRLVELAQAELRVSHHPVLIGLSHCMDAVLLWAQAIVQSIASRVMAEMRERD